MKPTDLYMDALQAAEALGVSVPTLYSYVSRKMVRSERVEGSRKRWYWRADIDRMSGRQPALPPIETAGDVVADTRITLITESGLFYRGQNVLDLVETSSIESLAALLWQADESNLFEKPLPEVAETWSRLRPTWGAFSAQERISAFFPQIERMNPRAYDLTEAGYARTGADALRWYATLLVNAKTPVDEPLHKFLARELKAPPGFDEVIRRLAVLTADHEFDSITYAVRSVANLGVTPYQAVNVGFIASQGQRFLAERLGITSRFLREILGAKDGATAVIQRLRGGESLPGFTKNEGFADPRTEALMRTLDDVLAGDAEFQRLKTAEAAALSAMDVSMDFILPAAFVGHRLGFEGNELGIGAIGRVVGWIAHAMEQFHDHPLIRPRGRYVGILPK